MEATEAVYQDKDGTLSAEDLTELLAAGTQEVHERAQRTQFIKDLLKQRLRRDLFKLSMVALYYTYTAMEEEIERNRDHPHFAPLYFPTELHRHEALALDLEYFYGPDWQNQISCSSATQEYVEHIHQVGRSDPVLLVAHAYTRYMGDLSGGQVLKKVAQRALKLPSTGEGVAFFCFDSIHSATAFKKMYFNRMNELELDRETKEKVVAESVKAFDFNIKVFEELDKVGKTMEEVVLNTDVCIRGIVGTNTSKCPFFNAKMGTAHIRQLAVAVLQHQRQLLVATWFAALAGLAAWHLM